MKPSIASRLLHPLKAKVCTKSHHEISEAAEAELSAFYLAVRIHHGTAAATTAADHWLQAFSSASIDRNNLEASFRKVTVAAASQLAKGLGKKQAGTAITRIGVPCQSTSASRCR